MFEPGLVLTPVHTPFQFVNTPVLRSLKMVVPVFAVGPVEPARLDPIEDDGEEVFVSDEPVLVRVDKREEGVELFITYVDVTPVEVLVQTDTVDDLPVQIIDALETLSRVVVRHVLQNSYEGPVLLYVPDDLLDDLGQGPLGLVL